MALVVYVQVAVVDVVLPTVPTKPVPIPAMSKVTLPVGVAVLATVAVKVTESP